MKEGPEACMRFPSEFLVLSRHPLFLSHALIQVHRMNVRCIYSNVLTECSFLSAFFFLTSSLSLVDPLDCIILFLSPSSSPFSSSSSTGLLMLFFSLVILRVTATFFLLWFMSCLSSWSCDLLLILLLMPHLLLLPCFSLDRLRLGRQSITAKERTWV